MTEAQAVEGLVVGLVANRPTVETLEGRRYLCHLRGRLRRDGGRILVGDRVLVQPISAQEAWVVAVLPRRSALARPPLANVSGMWAVFTVRWPSGDRTLLDRRLVQAFLADLPAEVLINKIDLLDGPGRAQAAALAAVYRAAGYPVWLLSAVTGEGLAELQRQRSGIWVLTGESGVGKSTIINALVPNAGTATGELSRIGRGRQTTRAVWLYPAAGFWLADAPGFGALELPAADPRRIRAAFGEWAEAGCRFDDCWHLGEPGCAVAAGVQGGRFDRGRYLSYRTLIEEARGSTRPR